MLDILDMTVFGWRPIGATASSHGIWLGRIRGLFSQKQGPWKIAADGSAGCSGQA
jgi:hypothetical protein